MALNHSYREQSNYRSIEPKQLVSLGQGIMQSAENVQQSDLQKAETHILFLSFFLSWLRDLILTKEHGQSNNSKYGGNFERSVANVMEAFKQAGYFWDAQTHGPLCTSSSHSTAKNTFKLVFRLWHLFSLFKSLKKEKQLWKNYC